MLKNKIVVRKIRNIVILLMAILIMVGAYKNIDRSRAENVIEISAIAMDNYSCLENEEFTLEAKEISEGLYEIEIPETINTKQVNQVVEVTIENTVQDGTIEEPEVIEITDNKIYLTTEQIENNQIKFKTVYDVAIIVIDEQGKYSKELFSEMTEEEIDEVKKMTEGTGLLYNRTLKYEENDKTLEVKGYMLDDVELDIQEVTQEQVSQNYGEVQIDVAYEIKTIRKIVTQVPADEINTNSNVEEIVEIIEINPMEYGEMFEVSITDSRIQNNSEVYYLKDEETCNEVEVNENTKENIIFNMSYGGVFAIRQQGVTFLTESVTSEITGTNSEILGVTTQATETTTLKRGYFAPAHGTWEINVTSDGAEIAVLGTYELSGLQYMAWTNSTDVPTTWNTVDSMVVNTNENWKYFSTPQEAGTWYLHVKTSSGKLYYSGEYVIVHDDSFGEGVYATTTIPPYDAVNDPYGVNPDVYVNISTSEGTISTSGLRGYWDEVNVPNWEIIDPNEIDEEQIPKFTERTETTTTHSYNVGMPYGTDREGEYYFTYKYYGKNSTGAKVTGYSRSLYTYIFDNKGPTILGEDLNAGDYYVKDWFNTDVNIGHIANGTYVVPGIIEWSEDGEIWQTLATNDNSRETAVSFTHILTEERSSTDELYYRATDADGNVGEIYTIQFGIDKTKPTISVSKNSDTVYTKTKDITITAEDALSGLANGTSYQYYLSTSSTELNGGSWKTYTNGVSTSIGEGLTGQFYLFVKTVSDNAGNVSTSNGTMTTISSTNYHRFGPYYFDNQAPTITLEPESDEEWKQSRNVAIIIEDEHAGLDNTGLAFSYGWSLSNTQGPTTWNNITLKSGIVSGDKRAEGIMDGSGITDKHYLWIAIGRIPDILGNSVNASERIISDGSYWFDNQAPTITLESENNESWATSHSAEVTLNDQHSGLAAGENIGIRYGWSTSLEDSPSSYATVNLTHLEKTASTTFTATTEGLITESGKYYLWVEPIETNYVKDMLGNTNSTVLKSTGTFWVDITAPTLPTVTSVHPSDNQVYNSGDWTNYLVHTSISSTDEHSGIASIEYSEDGENWDIIDFTEGALTQDETDATKWTGIEQWDLYERNDSYYFKVVDNVGNESLISDTADFNIKYDLTKPTAGTLDMKVESSTGADYTNNSWTNKDVYIQVINGTDEGEFVSGHATTLATITKDGVIYQDNVTSYTLTEDGTYTITVITTDNAGNISEPSETYIVNIDKTIPVWTYVDKDIYYSTPNDVGNDDYANKERTVKIIFKGTDAGGRTVTSSLTSDDILVIVKLEDETPVFEVPNSNKTLETVNNGTGEVTCTLTVTGIEGDGDLTISIPDGKLTDLAENTNIYKSLTTDIYIDNTNPIFYLNVTSPAAGTYKANEKITITATYNEELYKEITSNTVITTPADAPEMTLVFVDEEENETPSKGTVSCTAVNGNVLTYEYIIQAADNPEGTNGDNGTLKIKSLGQVYDAAGNPISFIRSESNIIADTIHPTIISITPDKTSPTNAENITYTIEFSETVTGFEAEDIIVNSGKGTVTSLTGSGTTYTAIISATDDAEYIETITVAEGACTDIAGNTNIEETSSEIVVDRIDPTLTITADQTSPTNAENIIYTLTFSENVTLSEVENIITNSGEESIAVSGTGTTYIVTVPTTENQTYIEAINVNVGAFIDEAGNGNVAATSTEILIDRIDPTLTVEPTSSTWVNTNLSVKITHNDDVGGSGITSTSGQYFLTIETSPTSAGTLSNYTSGTSFNLNPGVSGEYYLYIKEIFDNAGNTSNTSEYVEIDGVTYHKYGKYQFDYEKPIIERVSSSINEEDKTATIIFKATDALSGFASNTLELGKITVEIDGEEVQAIAKPETTEQQEANKDSIWMELTSTEVSANEMQYTLVLSNFEQSTKMGEKIYKDWSGNVSIEIPANAIQDNAGNTSDEKTIDGEFVDFIKPVVEKVSAENNVDGTNTQTIIFNVIDKYLDTSDLITIDEDKDGDGSADPELIVKVDGQEADITKTLSIVSKFVINTVDRTVTSQAPEYTLGDNERVIGQQYKLVLSDFEKTRPSGKYYKEWSGDVSIEIEANAVQDTSENKNDETTVDGQFADFIKPEFTYTYSESDINHTNESVTVVFDVTDKYFESTTLSNLDASQITVRVADYDTTTLNNAISKQLTKTATLVMNKTTKEVTVQSADYTITDTNAEQKVGERYQLVVTDLDQEDANGVGDGFKFSGHMSLAFNSGVITDKSGNISDATTITIGLNENDGEPNDDTIHGTGEIVDVVDPVWQLGNISLDEGEVELKAIDKYFGSVTIDEDDILVYVNGKLDGDANENGVLDEGETSNVTKDITSTTPTNIENGKQYTLKLSNITTGGADTSFTPYNVDELDNTAGFKYGDENGGTISIKILSGTITDQYGNTSVDQSFDIGVIDATKPRVYPVQNIQDLSAGTETIIFNVTDRNYDSTDLITLDVDKDDDGVVDPEITVWLDGNQIDSEVIKQLTYKPIYLDATTIVGHQYTLVLSEIVETDEQYNASGRAYRELSGTIEIRIAQDAVKDVKGNILNEAVTISDYIDYIKPELKELTVANPINTTDKTYTTSFEIRDKYLDDTSEDTQKVQEDEIKVYVDGELATAIAKPETAEEQESNKDKIWIELESTPITATFKKTVDGTITSESHVVGHTYTLVLSNFEQSVKQSGKNFMEWSGTVKIVVDQDAVNDKNEQTGALINTLDSDEAKRTVGGYHVDFIKPVVEKVESIRVTNTETIIFDVLDKYLDTSDEVTDGEITVYVDEETATLTKTLTKTAKFVMNKETKAITSQTIDYEVQSTEQVVGERYQLVLSGFEQSSRNAKNYKDWSGTVSIEIAENAVKDTSENKLAAEETKRILAGDFVDFINPDIKYTHQSTDISKGTKTYTMTFDITDKYYTTGQLELNNLSIKMQNGQVDTNGNAIIYDLKTLATQGKINIAFNGVPYYAEPNIKITNTSGVIEEITTANTHQIGHTYTLTISNLEKFEIETGLTTANYSGIVTVAIDGNVIQDRGPSGDGTSPNGNAGKTITSGVSIPGGTITDNAQVVDVVKPRIDKVSSSANAVNQTAEITFKGTDTYFVENSTISVDDMKVYVNGSEATSGITKTITATTELEEERIENYVQKIEDDELEIQTENVQYGIQYTLKITGFAQTVNQIKVKIPAGKLTDQYGNSNVETDLIIYNVLKAENMEEIDSLGKTVDEIETELDAILTDEFLGESAGTTIYPENSTLTPIARQDIEKIEFVNNLNNLLDGEIPKVWDTSEKEWNIKTGIQRVWDVSAQGDKSILAWTSQTTAPYTVYVGSAYEIFGNQNSRYLFAGIGSGTNSTATTAIVNLNVLNTSSVTSMYAMFYKFGYTAMTSLDLGSFNTSNVSNMFAMFSKLGYTAMTTFDIGENFNTSKVTNMGMMFEGCGYTAMTSLDLGDKFNTSNVSDMFAMFRDCGSMSMTTLNLGDKFDTSNVIDMGEMFRDCGPNMTNMYFGAETGISGKIVFPDNFKTSKVTYMGGMFYGFATMKMTSLDLGNNFDTSNVIDMSNMFNMCGILEMTTLNLGDKFNTSKVEDMSNMFGGCGNVKMTSLDLGDKFYTTSATDMSNMFKACGAKVMTVLDLGPAFTKIAETNTDMFKNCGTSELVIYAPESIYSNRTTFK